MKRKISLALAVVLLVPFNQAMAQETSLKIASISSQIGSQAERTYEVPIRMWHASEDKESMADKALVKTVKVEEKNGQYIYNISFQPMKIGAIDGNLTNLIVNGQPAQNAGDNNWSFSLNEKASEISVEVWVDAMDNIMGGGPGSGAQPARLRIDWSNAKLISENIPRQNDQGPSDNQVNKPVDQPKPTDQPKPVEEPRPVDQPKPTDQPKPVEEPRPADQTKPADQAKPIPTESNIGPRQGSEYNVPVRIINASTGGESMANKAVIPYMNISERDGRYLATIGFQDMKIGSAIGRVSDLRVDGSRTRKVGANTWEFELDSKRNRVNIYPYVDAMGSAPQAILEIDWSRQRTGHIDQSFARPVENTRPNITNSQGTSSSRRFLSSVKTNKDVKAYEVPAKILKASGVGLSMANNALDSTVRVEESNGKYTYFVSFRPMEMRGFTGNLTNFFVNGKQASGGAGGTWSFSLDHKASSINIAVWVDAMDEIAGGRGKGEQKAILELDWAQAKEVQSPNQADSKANENKKNNLQNAGRFTDIKGHWAEDVIVYAVNKGYFQGKSQTIFDPDSHITRAEFITALGRMAKVDTEKYKDSKFDDVSSKDYYSPYVSWAFEKGIVEGKSTEEFKPQDQLSREEMALIVHKFLPVAKIDLKDGQEIAYSDKSQMSDWALEAIKDVSKKGILQGMGDGSFSPKTSFTRAQVAQVLYNIDMKK